MGIKRIVDTAFWTDGKVDEFSPEDKYFMLYLLTNPFSKQLGIYEISIKQAAFQMGYSVDAFNVLLERFENKYKIILFSKETNEVAILNFLRHSVMKGGKPVEDCIKKEMTLVKNKALISAVFSKLHGREGLNETVKKIVDEYMIENEIQNDNQNDNDNENERTQGVSSHESSHDSLKDTYEAIVSHLNARAGTKYKHTSGKTKTCIRARLAEGFTPDDFKTVIDKKCDEWLGDPKMEQYLRPETLFGTKFEGYLNQKNTNRTQQAQPKKQGGGYDDFMAQLAAMRE